MSELTTGGAALQEKKTPEQLGAEIRMYVDAGRRISLLCGIEIGKRLVQAKEILTHGEWLPWLEKETEFSDRSAARYMKLFEEYGASQMGLFGPETNSPTLSNLPISKALALLSVPESERIEFAEEADAEHISVRELEKKIKEREMQLAESEKLRVETSELLKTQDEMLAEARKQIAELESRPVEVAVETVRDEEAIEAAVKQAKAEAEKENERTQDGLKKQLADSEKSLKDIRDKLEKAERDLTEAKATADSAGADAEKKIAEAGKEAERLKAELEEARKALKTSDAAVTAFGIRFNTVQSEWSYMRAEMKKVTERDADTGAKLMEAVRQLLEFFRKDVEAEK